MSKKSLVAAMLCAAVVTGAGASAAFAGEITGNGKPTQGPAHANSICVFSGKNDEPTAPPTGLDPGGVSQSYGQLNKLGSVDPHQFNPGDACRGGSNTPE
jgi:hypothetical protein